MKREMIKMSARIMVIMAFLTGCGKAEKGMEEVVEDVVQVIAVEQEAEVLSNLPQSKEELYSMELGEFKKMIENYIPNYREHFKVSDDYVIEDSDWENFRIILSLELFGSATADAMENENSGAEEAEEDPNAIYQNPDASYIESLSDEEFAVYLSGLQAYLYPDAETVDYGALSSEELKEVKETFLSEIE